MSSDSATTRADFTPGGGDQLVEGDHGAGADLVDLAVDAELGQHALQQAGVLAQRPLVDRRGARLGLGQHGELGQPEALGLGEGQGLLVLARLAGRLLGRLDPEHLRRRLLGLVGDLRARHVERACRRRRGGRATFGARLALGRGRLRPASHSPAAAKSLRFRPKAKASESRAMRRRSRPTTWRAAAGRMSAEARRRSWRAARRPRTRPGPCPAARRRAGPARRAAPASARAPTKPAQARMRRLERAMCGSRSAARPKPDITISSATSQAARPSDCMPISAAAAPKPPNRFWRRRRRRDVEAGVGRVPGRHRQDQRRGRAAPPARRAGARPPDGPIPPPRISMAVALRCAVRAIRPSEPNLPSGLGVVKGRLR